MTILFASLLIMTLAGDSDSPVTTAAEEREALQAEVVRGSIVDVDGRPIAGATVTLFDHAQIGEPLGDARGTAVKTNEAGEFAIETSLARKLRPTLVVNAPGFATTGDMRWSANDSANLKVTMHPGHAVRVRLLSPSGSPVTKQKVRLFAIPWKVGGTFFLRSRACELFTSQTDHDGWVTLDGLHRSGRAILMTGAGCEWGEQTASFLTEYETTEARLRPVGRVRLTVKDNEGRPLKGERLSVSSNENPFDGIVESGSVVVTDEQGVAEVSAIAAGRVLCRLGREEARRLRLATPVLGTVSANQTAEFEVVLDRTIPVRGRVVDAETGQPVPGVEIEEYSGFGATSDKNGDVSFQEVPGKALRLNSVRPPDGYLVGGVSAVFANLTEPISIPAGITEYQLPTFKLLPGKPISGVVVGTDGQPVANAKVRCAYPGRGVNYAGALTKETTSNEAGEFRFVGLPSDDDIQMTAIGDEAATIGHVQGRAGEPAKIVLQLEPKGWLSISGRVVNAKTGKAVAGVEVQLHQQAHQQVRQPGRFQTLDQQSLSTTSSTRGVFQFEPLARWGEIALFMSAPGFANQRLKIDVASGQDIDLRQVRMVPTVSVAGIVVDSQGQPLEDVRLFSDSSEVGRPWQEARTNKLGQFVMSLLHTDAFLIFAQKEGYRFSGQHLSNGRGLQIVLTRRDEPLPAEQRPKLSNVIIEQSSELADRILQTAQPYLDDPILGPRIVSQLMASKVTVPPHWVSRRLETAETPHERAMLAMLSGDFDTATALIGQIDDRQLQAEAYMQLADRLQHRDAKLDVLANSLKAARQINDSSSRVSSISTVIESLLDLNEQDRAKELVDELLPIAKQLANAGPAGLARRRFADELAIFHLPEALELLKDFPQPVYARVLGSIAQELAGRRPDDAESVLLMIADPISQRAYVARVCFRMALVDLDRASRLAKEVGEKKHGDPAAYVAIATALRASAPEKAAASLRQANDLMRGRVLPAAKGSPAQDYLATGAQAAILAAQLDLDEASEILWQVLAARPPLNQTDHLTGSHGFRERSRAVARLLAVSSLFNQQTESVRSFTGETLKQLLAEDFFKGNEDLSVVRTDPNLLAPLAVFDPEATVGYIDWLVRSDDKAIRQAMPSLLHMLLQSVNRGENDLWSFQQKWIFNQPSLRDEDF